MAAASCGCRAAAAAAAPPRLLACCMVAATWHLAGTSTRGSPRAVRGVARRISSDSRLCCASMRNVLSTAPMMLLLLLLAHATADSTATALAPAAGQKPCAPCSSFASLHARFLRSTCCLSAYMCNMFVTVCIRIMSTYLPDCCLSRWVPRRHIIMHLADGEARGPALSPSLLNLRPADWLTLARLVVSRLWLGQCWMV
eukprot:COSAG01_NODE_24272_length_784_cov_1.633577_1_plen_198_part_10